MSSVDFSNNSLLETVSLQNNNAALTSLDFSNNLNLKDLFCSDNNISSLNITNNTNLRWLWCSNNNLTSLDLSHTPLLANLYCQNNQLTYLDVKNGGNTLIDSHFDFRSSGNPNLTCIQVDNATYASNTWTSYVDNFSTLSEHCYETYVPDNNFEAYLEANNLGNGIANDDYVTTANISGLTFLNLAGQNVSDMTGINDFTALETLFVLSNLSLSSIDLSGNTNLKDFRCGDTALSNLNISMLSSLETLDIGNTNIMSIDVSNNSTLKTFWAVGVPISSLDVSNNTALEFLHVANTNFQALDLSNNSNLKQLYAQNSGLEILNVKNGNNTNITTFNTSGTPNLTCINVDDETYSTTNWTTIDAANNFSEYCYETYVPDDNFEDYLKTNNLGNGIVDDNYVTTTNISGLTSLNLASENISDMTGIEAFTALEILLVSDNTSLSSIDLSDNTSLKDFRCNSTAIGNLDISMLTALEILYISNTNINTIDLSLNTSLKTLWTDNTPITALNVNNNTLLQFLHVDNTNFPTLDVSSNTNLTQLFAQNSGLESLDMKNGNNTNITAFNTSATPNLTCINVDNAAYATTNWTLIDAANNFSEHCFDTYVPDDNFEQGLIDLGYDSVLDNYVPTENINTITSLSLVNKGIADFTGLEDFIGLTVLNIRNNINQTLDVTTLTNLERLFCYSNPSMTSINITGLTNLDYLRVNNTGLTTLDISTNTALEDLWAFNLANMSTNIDVSNNTLLDFLHLQNANQTGFIDISHLSNLRSLYLGINDITSLNVKTGNNSNMNVFETFNNPNLTCINVDNETYATTNFTNIDSASSFSEHCFETNTPDDNFENYLETHDASGNAVALGDASSLGNGIANDNYVTTSKIVSVMSLNISSKMIADITGIENFTALEILDFSTNGVGNFNLSNNNALKELYCASNGMSSIDIAANTNLEILDCSDNSNLTIDISTNVNLKELNAADNGTTSLVLGSISALEKLNLSNNNVPTINFSNLSNLTDLNCNNNFNFNVSDFSPLTNLVNLNVDQTSITSINLSSNTLLETLSIRFLAGFDIDLSYNTALTSISAQSSDLTSLNMQNGNNANITLFDARFNQFSCIQVDDPAAAYLSTWLKDANTSFEANCSLTSIPDSDFEYYLENHDASGNIVAVGSPISMGNGIVDDGYVLTTRISSVTSLDISNLSIGEVIGIQDFTALEILNCSQNNFNDLVISNLTNLRELYCHSVFLPVLDLSSNTNLEKLIMYDANCSNLTLGQNTALLEMSIRNNSLSTFNTTYLTALETLNYENNSISSLNIDNLTNLKTLNANNNNVNSLDLSNNVLLESLYIDTASGFDLDLSNNTALISLSANNSDLSSLNVQNGNNANITYFDARSNVFDCIKVDDPTAPYLIMWQKDATTVFSLDCRKTYIPDDNFENYLETHNASGNVVSVGDATSMGNGIANDDYVNTSAIEFVTNLDIANNGITNLVGIEDFTALEVLNCARNAITNIDVTQNTLLTELRCSNNTLATINLSQNLMLERLYCSRNGMTSLDVTLNTSLNTISCYSNSLTSLDVTQNTLLTDLDCVENQLTSLDVTQNTGLIYFYCYNNSLTSLDVTQNTLLEEFYCEDNQITSLDLSNCTVLDEFACTNNNLTSLNLKNGNNTALGTLETQGNPDLTCVLVDDATYATTNWTRIDSQTIFSDTDCKANLNLKTFIQGAALNPNTGEETLMRDDLRVAGLIAINSPYEPSATTTSVLNVTGDKAVVDWILVELRDASDNTSVVTSMGGLLLRDGSIVSTDGVSSMKMFANPGKYYVTIKHRNHLGIMTNTAMTILHTGTTIDFSDANNQITYGSNAQTTFGMPSGKVAMWAGNANADTVVQYSGTTPDTPSVLSKILNDPGNFLNFPTYTVNGYDTNDINMDGNTQYSGTNPDTPFILQNVLAHPGNFLNFSTYQITEQLPEN